MNIIEVEYYFLKEEDIKSQDWDFKNKDSEINIDSIIHVLTMREGTSTIPFYICLFIIACCCNQFGMSPKRTIELIESKYRFRFTSKGKLEYDKFSDKVKDTVLDAYNKYKHLNNTIHKEEDGKYETPLIPQAIHDSMPPMLRRLSTHFLPGRERDVFLLSALVVLSSCFPSVKGCYDNKLVSALLFLLICAPASAGKGVMNWARRLGNELHKDVESKYAVALEEYNANLEAYKEAKTNGEDVKPPQKPERQHFFIPANITASKLIQVLKANGNFGVIIETETDTLITALKSQHGDFSDIMRKTYHHEAIALLRKTNDEYVSIERSYLSAALSGTPDQLKNLVTSVENGFFSRFLFYEFPINVIWKDVFSRSIEEPEGEFLSASVKLLQFSKQVAEKAAEYGGDIYFRLTEQQEDRFNEWFSHKQALIHEMYGDQLVASVRRLGLTTFRIAMILTTLRCETMEISQTLYCSDEDLNAALTITETCLEHAISVYTKLKRQKGDSVTDRKTQFYDKLPETFNRTMYLETALQLNINGKTAENYITGYIKDESLRRIEHNSYQKN
jgi:hypothetical protein